MSSHDLPGEAEVRRIIADFQYDGLRRVRKAVLQIGGPGPQLDYELINLTVQAEYGAEPYVQHVVQFEMRGIREIVMPKMLGWIGFGLLVIDNVQDWQHEGVRYRISDIETPAFYCLCRSVRFTRVLCAEHEAYAEVLWEDADRNNA